MTDDQHVCTVPFRVRFDEAGPDGHVRTSTLLRYAQDLAAFHSAERGFDRDHYDVPSEWYDKVVDAGATPVSSRELVTRLVKAGLRVRKAPPPPR